MKRFKKSVFREYFESIVVAVVLALFIRTWVVQAFKIPTGSMENNLLIGDHLLVNKFIFSPTLSRFENSILPVGKIRRGDVAVFKYPADPERDFIKRVIGLPGETVEVNAKNVYIDGRKLDEAYTSYFNLGQGDVRKPYGPVVIPAKHYFVMGDNRDNSQDSRYWGFLPEGYFRGRALMVYWSYESNRQDYIAEGLGSGVKRVLSISVNFFSRTRWERLFHQIR